MIYLCVLQRESVIITKIFGSFSLQITFLFLGDASRTDEHLSFYLNNYHTSLMINCFTPYAALLTMKCSCYTLKSKGSLLALVVQLNLWELSKLGGGGSLDFF